MNTGLDLAIRVRHEIFISLYFGFGKPGGTATISIMSPSATYRAPENNRYKKGGTDRLLEIRIQQLMLALVSRLFFRFISVTEIIMISGIVNFLSFIGSVLAAEAVAGF
jgi:hypothetical protein